MELARLMGWGEATISRYESKSIQDESYDVMLCMVRDSPFITIELLDEHHGEPPHLNRCKTSCLKMGLLS